MNMTFINIALTKVNFTINREFKPEENKNVTVLPDLAINNEIKKDEKQLIVLLGVRQITGNIPYYFEVESVALFQFDEIPEEKTLKQLSDMNCPAIMFPYIRETIADLTRRAGFQPLHLNPINFVKLAQEREKQLKQTASAPSV